MNPAPEQALQLRDIHLPGAAPWWPPAPGWWLVAAVACAVLAWLAVLAARRYRRYRERRRLFEVLARVEREIAGGHAAEALAQLSIVLRRLALVRFPRRQLAGLTGTAWLDFLDESGGDGRFAQGPGRVLAAGPYQRSLPPDLDGAALIALVRQWVRKNTGT